MTAGSWGGDNDSDWIPAMRPTTTDRMPDIQTPEERGMTHYEGCWRHHRGCAEATLADITALFPDVIAARDAAIRREEREACAEAAASRHNHHVHCGHGAGYMDGREDAGAAIRAREPGAVGSSTTPATEVTDAP